MSPPGVDVLHSAKEIIELDASSFDLARAVPVAINEELGELAKD